VVYSFVVELGKGGNLSPFLAAWLGNFIFAMVGVYLLLSVRH
jgi:lipopolysaccharide export LptBFGC system permease protein LptF